MSSKDTPETVDSPNRRYAITLIWTGILGWFAAFSLTLERIHLAENPNATLSCDINPFISCKSVMLTAQSHLLGFPNPLIGLSAFMFPIAVGVAVLAGARFAHWFWRLFTVGISMGLLFVLWLFWQSVFVIHVLCPYCMVAWAGMIPLFWRVILQSASDGTLHVPERIKNFALTWRKDAWMFAVVTELLAIVAIVFSFWSAWPALFR